MKDPIISIVMPVYNTEKYIKKAIDSILTQTFGDFELIIVNDGSTDRTLNIITGYIDSRIQLINNKHDYINSLNKGMSAAKGKYIARMDADDIMISNRLQIQFDYLEKNPDIDVCGGGMQLFGLYKYNTKPSSKHTDIILNAIEGCPLNHPTTMMKTEIRNLFELEDNLYQVYKKGYICAEDYKLWVDLIMKGCKLENIPVILNCYRTYESQSTSVLKEEMIKSTTRIQAEYLEFLISKILKIDEDFSNMLNASMKLFSFNKISFNCLKKIVILTAENIKDNLPDII